jgi:hypothetical protein
MRWVPSITQAIIVGIALYFILFWGCDAVRVLTAEGYGLDDPARAEPLRGLGRMLGLGPADLFRLAAFIAAYKLTAVAVFAVHLIGRARAAPGAPFSHDILEAALLLVVILTAVLTAPAVSDNNGTLIRHYAIDLLLAGAAAILSVVERFVMSGRGQGADAARPR